MAGAALAALVGLGSVDLLASRARLDASAWPASFFLTGFDAPAAEGSRRGDGAAAVRVEGLWPDAAVRVELVLSAKNGPRRLRVLANEREVADASIGEEPGPLAFEARSSPAGALLLQVHGGRRDETVYRLTSVTLRQTGPRRIPLRRLLQYAVLGGLVGLLALWLAGPLRGRWIAAAVLLLDAALVAHDRVLWLPHLGAMVAALGGTAALGVAASLIAGRTRMPVWAAWPALLLCALHLLAACDRGFGSIDAEWHAHNLMAFRGAGQLITSDAPGLARAPYPPAFYALVAPFGRGDYARDVRLVRIAMALLAGAAPFLVFGIAAALRLPTPAPGMAALLAACMPEAILVLEKGIAANVLGQFAMLLSVLLVARRAHWSAQCAAFTLLLLSHAPAALLGVLLLAAWGAEELRRRTIDPREAARRAGVLAIAGLLAWAVYYREVGIAFGNPSREGEAARFFEPHWYRVAKVAQDLVLKFGGAPVVLAALAFSRAVRLPSLGPLVLPWCAITGLFAVVAVLTPFPLRFEYFAVPLVALLAGLYAAGPGRARAWCFGAAGLGVLLQGLLGVRWRLGRFDVIAAILESPRWR